MFPQVLVPLDGSPLAEAILPHALALARPAQTELVLLHVLEEGHTDAGVDPIEWHLRMVAAQSYLDGLCARIQELGVVSSCLLLTGSPVERILEQAAKLPADLVLLSRHGQSGRVDWALGAVAHRLLEGLGTSVMLIQSTPLSEPPAELAPVHYHKVLVALDGSRRAECILPLAEQLAPDAELVLAHVVQRPGLLGWGMLAEEHRRLAEQLMEQSWSVAESYLDQIRTRQGLPTTVALAQADNVAIELVQIAEQHQVDLLLMSAHGAALNPRRSFGDTVNGVITYCRQPMLLYQDRPVVHSVESEPAPAQRNLANTNGALPPTVQPT